MPDPADRPNPETTAVTAGRSASGDSLAPVLFPSTTYVVDEVADHAAMVAAARPTQLYSRFGSPTVRDFEDAVAELEGAEAAIAAASGMATISTVLLGLCSQGDHVVATRQVFSVTYALLAFHLPRFGIEVTFVDGTDAAAIADAVIPGRTQVILAETPANPALSLVDLDALAAIEGPFKVVDSTFAGPVVQRPLAHGADLVLHAATKGIAGHNDALLGVVAGQRRADRRDRGLPRRPGGAGLAVRRVERGAGHPHAARSGAAAVRVGPPAGGLPRDPACRRVGVATPTCRAIRSTSWRSAR